MAGMSQTRQGGESRGRDVTGVRLAAEAEERKEAKSLSTGGEESGCVIPKCLNVCVWGRGEWRFTED